MEILDFKKGDSLGDWLYCTHLFDLVKAKEFYKYIFYTTFKKCSIESVFVNVILDYLDELRFKMKFLLKYYVSLK